MNPKRFLLLKKTNLNEEVFWVTMDKVKANQ